MDALTFIVWTIFVLWMGFLAGQWWFFDRQYPHRMKCDGECYEDVPFRIASNEKVFARQGLLHHLELQHDNVG